MTAEEFERWLPAMRDAYADDIARNGGGTAEAARRKAEADVERLFPGSAPVPEQLVFVVEADGGPVGDLWLSVRDVDFGRLLWIYDVRIEERHRGRGYGREAMTLAEVEARRLGLDRVGLNVFGGNEVARGLYRSLGYAENAVFMTKQV
jgi:RimJ/RimL family protein N-acetyltransferase